ncbi:MAG: purine-binding chemotaxis protein CheW [Gammaproteobacteria bacterium]|nr:purine-binding chemotaxis protein CheW [Gammaproteobacteria bacterium]
MNQAATSDPLVATRDVPSQVLTFSLGEEHFGVDILRVKEIRGWTPVTKIPQVPPHVLGVLNLRGSIVPIVDLRVRFGLAHAEFTPLTVIIVLTVNVGDTQREFGLVVDGVSDVVNIAAENLKDTPSLGSAAAAACIRGLAVVAERMLILLDVDTLIERDAEQIRIPPLAGAA